MTRALVLGVLLGAGAVSVGAAAYRQQPPAPKVVMVEKVKDNLFVLTGGGGNSAVFIGETGVVIVDAKNPGWGQTLLDQVKTLTPKPVTMLINTHTHGDHVGGNIEFPTSVDIVAHENTKASTETMDAFKNNPGKGRVKRTFKDTLSLGSGKDRIDLYYFGPGHTNGDTWVVFPALRVLEAGDMFAFKNIPLADPLWGGSGVQYPETVGKALASIKNVDTVITGHSTVMTWADLGEYRAFTKDFLDWTRDQMKAGKSVDEAAAAYQLPAKYPGYIAPAPRVKNLVQAIYTELQK